MARFDRRVLLGVALVGAAIGGAALPQTIGFTTRASAQGALPGPRRDCPASPAVAAAPAPTQTAAAPSATPDPVETGTVDTARDPYKTRIVVVEWKIKQGRECDFLEYWATRSTIPNRSGLIGEFLSEVDAQPWVNWKLEEGSTTYYNVGIWRDAPAFQDQIGKFIDNNRPPLEFEAAKRARVFLAPERWRIGQTTLPAADAAGVR